MSDTYGARSAQSSGDRRYLGDSTVLERREDPTRVSALEAWRRRSESILRRGAAAMVPLVVVGGLTGCGTSGTLQFEGSDSIGSFSGQVIVFTCEEKTAGNFQGISFFGARTWVGIEGDSADELLPAEEKRWVSVGTRGGAWKLSPSLRRTYDVRMWFDAERHRHVFVQLDCRTKDGVHFYGTVQSQDCHVIRPG